MSLHLAYHLIHQRSDFSKIALQLALLIANIARFDLPQHWPELIPSLMQLTQTTSNQVERHNALHALQQVIKVLSSRRLAQNKREFEEVFNPVLFSSNYCS